VVDAGYEDIAVREAKRMNIPCIGIADTNSDPTLLSHPIPGNDDATKAIRIIVDTIVEAIQKGLAQREARRTAPLRGDKTDSGPEGAPAEAAAPAEGGDEEAVTVDGAGKAPARKRTPRTGAKASAVSTEDV